MTSKLWYEVAYSFPNFACCTVDVWEWTSNFSLHLKMNECCYLSVMWLPLMHVCKRDPRSVHSIIKHHNQATNSSHTFINILKYESVDRSINSSYQLEQMYHFGMIHFWYFFWVLDNRCDIHIDCLIKNKRIFKFSTWKATSSLLWRHNVRDSVLNHQPHDRLLNRLFKRR